MFKNIDKKFEKIGFIKVREDKYSFEEIITYSMQYK